MYIHVHRFELVCLQAGYIAVGARAMSASFHEEHVVTTFPDSTFWVAG